jgi:glycerol-3-phosphate dehydrogenase (NAD(P)+)
MKNIAIIGSGSWGVALGIHLAKLGNNIKIWSFAEDEAGLINNEKRCKFLPNVIIPDGIVCTMSYEEAIKGSDLILHVTPSKFTRSTLKEYKEFVTNQPIIICSKGFELDTLSTLEEVILSEIPNAKVGVLSGPSHAEEVSIGSPTVLVAASKDNDLVKMLQDTFMCETMRVYTTNDVKGVETGGALKNILAFCGGIATEIGLGDNAFAALITRGLVEISRLGIAMGGQKETFYGLTGLGDLLVTCYSDHSRNRKAGKLIGAGMSIEETKKEVGMTIESIDNIDVAYKLGKKYNVDLPIVNTVYDVLYNNLDPKEAVKLLMTRDKKAENDE